MPVKTKTVKSLVRQALPLLCIEIVEGATGKVEKKLGPFSSMRLRDRADDGVNRRLDHERYYTRFAR